jgi:DNA-binding beta-propeller fold protein YncE
VSPVDGNVYIASVGGDEITVHDTQNGKVLDRLGPERGVAGLMICPSPTTAPSTGPRS